MRLPRTADERRAPSDAGSPRPRSRAGRRALAACVLAAASVALCAGAALTAERAAAVFDIVHDPTQPGDLVVNVADATPLFATIAPGDSVHWLLEARLFHAEEGSFELEFDADGGLVTGAGLSAGVTTCDTGFEIISGDPVCAGAVDVAVSQEPLTELSMRVDPHALPALRHDTPRELLVTLRLPPGAANDLGEPPSADIGVGLHAAHLADGDDPPARSPELPVTGSDLLALGLVGAGLVGLAGGVGLWRRGVRPARADKEAR